MQRKRRRRLIEWIDLLTRSLPSALNRTLQLLPSLLCAVVIMVGSKLFTGLAVHLTDLENHQTDTQYEDSMISKVCPLYITSLRIQFFFFFHSLTIFKKATSFVSTFLPHLPSRSAQQQQQQPHLQIFKNDGST